MKHKYLLSLLLFSWFELNAEVVMAVSPVKISPNSSLNSELLTDLFQTSISKRKPAKIRDWRAIPETVLHLQECQTGVIRCNTQIGQLSSLDVVVFSEVQELDKENGYLASARVVDQESWTVIYSGSIQSKNHESALSDIADDLSSTVNLYSTGKKSLKDLKNDSGKYRIAIYPIRPANEAAQGIDVGPVLESILISQFNNKSRFEIVEKSRVQDLLVEKQLQMSGLMNASRTDLVARGATHYFSATLQVYDEVRVLSWKIVSNETGLSIAEDLFEWTEKDDPKKAMLEVAKTADDIVFDQNGSLIVAGCNAEGALISYQSPEEISYMIEMGKCPLRVEGIPAGKYTLIFQHDDYNSLTQQIVVEPQKITKLDFVTLPEIDLSGFQNAQNLEFKNKYDEAILAYKKFYETYPMHRMSAYAMYREGYIIQINQKKFNDGRQILEKVIQKKPDANIRSEAYFGIAMGYKASGNPEKSASIFRMLINEYPATTAAEASRICLEEEKCSF